jgi:crotonobetainyl-CoA:carnitine CoA-transferase CaiB-like acyl-CoA transferase
MQNVFSGLKVLELAGVLAGPSVGRFFLELGAKVIKIENPDTGGDITRRWKSAGEKDNNEPGSYYLSVNEGKTILELNLKNTSDKLKFFELLSDTDVLITNFTKGKEKIIFESAEDVRVKYPQLIWINICGYAAEPGRPAFDLIVQAEAGYMDLNRLPDALPQKIPVAMMDILAGHQAKQAALIGLWRREREKRGMLAEVYLFESAFAAWFNQSAILSVNQEIPQPSGSLHPHIAPYGEIYQTRDGVSFVLAVGTDKQFSDLCSLLNIPDVVLSDKFKTNPQRVKNRNELNIILQNSIKALSADEFLKLCLKYNIPVGKINNLKAAADQLGNDFKPFGQNKTYPTVGFKIID